MASTVLYEDQVLQKDSQIGNKDHPNMEPLEASKLGNGTAVNEANVPEKKKAAKLQDTDVQEVSNGEDEEDASILQDDDDTD